MIAGHTYDISNKVSDEFGLMNKKLPGSVLPLADMFSYGNHWCNLNFILFLLYETSKPLPPPTP